MTYPTGTERYLDVQENLLFQKKRKDLIYKLAETREVRNKDLDEVSLELEEYLEDLRYDDIVEIDSSISVKGQEHFVRLYRYTPLTREELSAKIMEFANKLKEMK